MDKRRRSLKEDHNHLGYFVLYTWSGYWALPEDYDDDVYWEIEENEPQFWLNDTAKENEAKARTAFQKCICDYNGVELWLVEKDLNEIYAHQLAKYYTPYDKTEEMVINDTLCYDEKNPYYSWL